MNPKTFPLYKLYAKTGRYCLIASALLMSLHSAKAAYLFEIDTDTTNDGSIAYHPGFSFGGDTTTASASTTTSSAFGTTSADSIFGGDGVALPDTYEYVYTPDSDADNLAIPGGTDLGSGNLASGETGGTAGTYRVYATWPFTNNVSGGDTNFTVSTPGMADISVDIDQNNSGDEWIFLGEVTVADATNSITVTQQPTDSNSFVSMRAYGLLFELQAEEPPGDAGLPPAAIPTGNWFGWLFLATLLAGFGSWASRRFA